MGGIHSGYCFMTDIDTVTTSNAIRLSGRQWAGLAVFMTAVYLVVPRAWTAVEKFEPGADYRVPLALGNDYWHFGRWAAEAAKRSETLVVGDSVVWGHFAQRHQTLTHHLDAVSGAGKFANLGIDGTHPAALEGLLAYYGGAIRDRQVVLLCNPTWMSSPDPDLQNPKLREEKVFPYNHEPLIPQFGARLPFASPIPCYREKFSRRLGHAMDRNIPFMGWARHLQVASFGDKSIPEWTLDHPCENPLAALRLESKAVDECPGDAFPWSERGLKRVDYPWVDLEASIQWASFRRTVSLLRARGNRLLVVVGPYNEHFLQERSLERYRTLKRGIADWLKGNGVEHLVAAVLPTGTYADASHPLDAGYKLLAQEILAQPFFNGSKESGR